MPEKQYSVSDLQHIDRVYPELADVMAWAHSRILELERQVEGFDSCDVEVSKNGEKVTVAVPAIHLGEGQTVVSDVCGKDNSWSGIMVSVPPGECEVSQDYGPGDLFPLVIITSANPVSFDVIREKCLDAQKALQQGSE